MKFSEARLSHLSHRIVEAFRKEGLAEFTNERVALNEIKRVLGESYDRDAQVDAIVRRKIQSLSRNIPPGSGEWDVLYRKYFEEEARKLKI